MKQLPSTTNALGLVKFMFPNPYNIYLHDTPAKDLFMKEVRDFSHGCIRLHEPFDFAYALLEKQTDEPQSEFQNAFEKVKKKLLSCYRKAFLFILLTEPLLLKLVEV